MKIPLKDKLNSSKYSAIDIVKIILGIIIQQKLGFVSPIKSKESVAYYIVFL